MESVFCNPGVEVGKGKLDSKKSLFKHVIQVVNDQDHKKSNGCAPGVGGAGSLLCSVTS